MITEKKRKTNEKKRKPLTIINEYAFFLKQWPSNWEFSLFELDGSVYNCVEQWMMAEKARVFGDLDIRNAILSEKHPKVQKDLGRMVKNYDDAIWSELRCDIVLKGTVEKYRQNKWLRDLLFATGNLKLVEASPYDKIWGIGLSENDPLIADERNWKGLNLLGSVITEAREILRAQS